MTCLTRRFFSPKWARESRYWNSIRISTCLARGACRRRGVLTFKKEESQLTVLSSRGKEAVVAILSRHFLAKVGMNGHPLRIANGHRRWKNVVINVNHERAMIAALHDDRNFRNVYAYLLTGTAGIEEDLIDQAIQFEPRGGLRMLLLLAISGKEGSPQPINPHISQETLAEMVGTTRSRVSRFHEQVSQTGPHQLQRAISRSTIPLLSAVLHEKPC